jgi:hypothetical protein
MAEGDKITTTSSMQPRSSTQESAQQVRRREALDDASHRTTEPAQVDVAACISNIDGMLDNIGKESLQLTSSEELVAFLNHITFAKVDLQRLAEAERQKAMADADTHVADTMGER